MSDTRPSFGIFILQDAPWPTLRERARRAEAMGFDTIWVADHFVNPYAPKADWFDGWTLLAALAATTTSIRLGTLVASITLRHPVLLAREAMTVDHVSGGRLELGIGPAGAPFDYSMLGLSAWSPRERVDRLEESLAIVIPLLEQGVVHHAGRYHAIDEAFVAPLPVQRPRPPITVGALGPRAIEVAAHHRGRLEHLWRLGGPVDRRQADARGRGRGNGGARPLGGCGLRASGQGPCHAAPELPVVSRDQRTAGDPG